MAGINQAAETASVIERLLLAKGWPQTEPGEFAGAVAGSSVANLPRHAAGLSSNVLRAFFEPRTDSPFMQSTPTLAGASLASALDLCGSSAASLPARVTDDFAAMLLSSSSVTLADGWLKSGTTLTSDDLAIGLGRVRLADGFAVQSRRRRARRVATERCRTEVKTHLDEARRSTAARRAYESFERAVEVITSSDNASLAPLLSYLGDDDAPYRDTLLSCLADRDVPLLDAPAIKRVASLLSHQNRELARSAALALTAGGERATEGLQVALRDLDASRRADLERLLSFAVT